MHIPDGFINGVTSAGAGVIAAGGVGAALRQSGKVLQDKRIPMTGLVAAFIFALQMLNFPVAAGTSGHLIGGALAVILVGPWLGVAAVSTVVIVQSFLFADGGVSALGLNTLNMAIISGLVGWVVFRGITRVLPKRWTIALVATFAAGLVSVVAAATGFVVQYSLGGVGDVNLATVFTAMVGVHFLIGIGEGLITAAVVGLVAASRPDLVFGTHDLNLTGSSTRIGRGGIGGFVGVGLAVALVLALVVAPLASSDPDGLERVAIDQGFADDAVDGAAADSPLADYGEDTVGVSMAGAIGIAVTFAVGVGALGMWALMRRRRRVPT